MNEKNDNHKLLTWHSKCHIKEINALQASRKCLWFFSSSWVQVYSTIRRWMSFTWWYPINIYGKEVNTTSMVDADWLICDWISSNKLIPHEFIHQATRLAAGQPQFVDILLVLQGLWAMYFHHWHHQATNLSWFLLILEETMGKSWRNQVYALNLKPIRSFFLTCERMSFSMWHRLFFRYVGEFLMKLLAASCLIIPSIHRIISWWSPKHLADSKKAHVKPWPMDDLP